MRQSTSLVGVGEEAISKRVVRGGKESEKVETGYPVIKQYGLQSPAGKKKKEIHDG